MISPIDRNNQPNQKTKKKPSIFKAWVFALSPKICHLIFHYLKGYPKNHTFFNETQLFPFSEHWMNLQFTFCPYTLFLAFLRENSKPSLRILESEIQISIVMKEKQLIVAVESTFVAPLHRPQVPILFSPKSFRGSDKKKSFRGF